MKEFILMGKKIHSTLYLEEQFLNLYIEVQYLIEGSKYSQKYFYIMFNSNIITKMLLICIRAEMSLLISATQCLK